MPPRTYRTTGLERPDQNAKYRVRGRRMPTQHCKRCGRECGFNFSAGTQYCSTDCANRALQEKP